MEAFPENLAGAIAARLALREEEKKKTWMTKHRDLLFESLVLAATHSNQTFTWAFQPWHYKWHTEICLELLVEHAVPVQIFIRGPMSDEPAKPAAKILPFESWDRIDFFDRRLEDLSRRYEAFAKIKIP